MFDKASPLWQPCPQQYASALARCRVRRGFPRAARRALVVRRALRRALRRAQAMESDQGGIQQSPCPRCPRSPQSRARWQQLVEHTQVDAYWL